MISRKTAVRAALFGGITVIVVSVPAICTWWCNHSACSADRAATSDTATVVQRAVVEQPAVDRQAPVEPARENVEKATGAADATLAGKSRAAVLRSKMKTAVPLERPDYKKFKVTIPSPDPEDSDTDR